MTSNILPAYSLVPGTGVYDISGQIHNERRIQNIFHQIDKQEPAKIASFVKDAQIYRKYVREPQDQKNLLNASEKNSLKLEHSGRWFSVPAGKGFRIDLYSSDDPVETFLSGLNYTRSMWQCMVISLGALERFNMATDQTNARARKEAQKFSFTKKKKQPQLLPTIAGQQVYDFYNLKLAKARIPVRFVEITKDKDDSESFAQYPSWETHGDKALERWSRDYWQNVPEKAWQDEILTTFTSESHRIN